MALICNAHMKGVRLLSTLRKSKRWTTTAQDKLQPVQQPEDKWVEVIDKPTNQVYYWNKKTGLHDFFVQ